MKKVRIKPKQNEKKNKVKESIKISEANVESNEGRKPWKLKRQYAINIYQKYKYEQIQKQICNYIRGKWKQKWDVNFKNGRNKSENMVVVRIRH